MAEPTKPDPKSRDDPAGRGAEKRVNLEPHPLVLRLRGEAEEPASRVMLTGYLGPAPQRPDAVRLYLDLEFQSYYVLPRAAVLATEPADPKDENSPTIVFVEAAAKLELVQVSTQTVEASYLRGAIAESHLAQAMAVGIEPSPKYTPHIVITRLVQSCLIRCTVPFSVCYATCFRTCIVMSYCRPCYTGFACDIPVPIDPGIDPVIEQQRMGFPTRPTFAPSPICTGVGCPVTRVRECPA